MTVSIANLNYYYYVGYFEGINLEDPKGKETVSALQRNNRNLTNYVVSKDKLMPLLPDEIVTHKMTFQTAYPGLLIGVGIAHGFNGEGEAALGLCLDYVTGMPYIPGSSVKGALRDAFRYPEYIREILRSVDVQNSEQIDVHKLEAHIFGNALKGKQYPVKPFETDTFFDAVIVSTGKILDTDTITPHRGDKELLELAEPRPVTIMRIRPDVRFRFQFSLQDNTMGVTAEQKLKLFQKIIEDFGIGAKTNVGYGIFDEAQIIDPTICLNCGGSKSANYDLCQKCASSKQNNSQLKRYNKKENNYGK